jgi:hypothetical protein
MRTGWRRHLRRPASPWHRQRGSPGTRRRGCPRLAVGRPQEAHGEAPGGAARRHRPERAHRRRRRHHLPAGLPHEPGGHRVEAAERPLPLGPVAGLAQGEEDRDSGVRGPRGAPPPPLFRRDTWDNRHQASSITWLFPIRRAICPSCTSPGHRTDRGEPIEVSIFFCHLRHRMSLETQKGILRARFSVRLTCVSVAAKCPQDLRKPWRAMAKSELARHSYAGPRGPR